MILFIQSKLWDMIIDTCPEFNGAITNPPMQLEHAWQNISHSIAAIIVVAYFISNITIISITLPSHIYQHVVINNALGHHSLSHSGQVTPYGDTIRVNIGSGNGLLPDGTKLLAAPMLTDHQWGPVTFISGQFHKRCVNHQSLKSTTYLKFDWNFPEAKELIVPRLHPLWPLLLTWFNFNPSMDK